MLLKRKCVWNVDLLVLLKRKCVWNVDLVVFCVFWAAFDIMKSDSV